MESVDQFKDLTITYYAPSGATLLVYTDMPGSALTLRRTITMPATGSERETKTFPIDTPALVEGKLIKFKATSPATLILYEGSIRFRRVGTYIDGASGDVWETQPLSLGA